MDGYNFQFEYVTYDELFHAYLDCRKRKRSTHNALEFEINENVELYKLWKDLNEKKYEIGKSIVFCVDKPVKREVFAADFRDRIVHHLVINRINDILEEEFIDDSYSCRKGKGTMYGVERCFEYIKEATENYTKTFYIVKCDLKSFFMTIKKDLLYGKLVKFLNEKYKTDDKKQLIYLEWLIKLIVFNKPQNNCIMKQSWEHWKDLPKNKSLFFCNENNGIPIGNLTSQIFANFYLSEFDHFVKDELGIKYYGRYVDDFFFMAYDKNEIKIILVKMRKKLESLGAMLHPNKLYIQETSKGIKFIGAVLKNNRIYIGNRTKGNFYWCVKKYNDSLKKMIQSGKEPTRKELEHVMSSINSYIGFMIHYKTYNIRKRVFESFLVKELNNYCSITKDYSKVMLNDKSVIYDESKSSI